MLLFTMPLAYKLWEVINQSVNLLEGKMNSILHKPEYICNSNEALLKLFGFYSSPSNNNVEIAILIALDKNNKVLSYHQISQNRVAEVFFPELEINRILSDDNISSLYLSHNHPVSDLSLPSKEDIMATEFLRSESKRYGKQLLDHLIIAGDNYYSFRDAGLLD